jgi:hypothetical protein
MTTNFRIRDNTQDNITSLTTFVDNIASSDVSDLYASIKDAVVTAFIFASKIKAIVNNY